MKILYAVQATGNGHLSRAVQVTPYLQQFGEVDVLLSGSNSTLPVDLPVKYRSKGISLFNDSQGGLDFIKIIKNNHWIKAMEEARHLPVDQYDLIINDFEPICARACTLKNKPSVQFSHQASFRSPHTPRPKPSNRLGEWIFRSYSASSSYIGLHFQSYDQFILPPVIKQSLINASPADHGHITVYLFGYSRTYFERQFHPLPDVPFHCFISGITQVIKSRNILFYPIDNVCFTQSLLTCHGVITGAGFETPAEALYLGKNILCVPCQNHYEQYCNAAALKLMGITIVTPSERHQLSHQIKLWLDQSPAGFRLVPNNLNETVQMLIDIHQTHVENEEADPQPYPFWPVLRTS